MSGKIIQYPPLSVDELLRRIRDDIANISLRGIDEIKSARVTNYRKKKLAGAAALKEFGSFMYSLGVEIEGV